MGSLKPGATYIYEQDGGIVYAREVGSDPSTRRPIGWNYGHSMRAGGGGGNNLEEENLWQDIRYAAKNNPTLHEALERVKMLYYLIKENA
jgi:hypothetical protein